MTGPAGFLSLADALKSDRIEAFIAQEETRGVGPADKPDLHRALARVIKAERSEDQTSLSTCVDGLTGTKTR
jgi:hypothetical protein